MYAFSGKVVWVPLYASLLYVIGRNLRWQVAVGCAVAIALTIVLADQIGAVRSSHSRTTASIQFG